jgi:hypothetical protein
MQVMSHQQVMSQPVSPEMVYAWVHCIQDFESTTDEGGIMLVEVNSNLVSRRTFSKTSDMTTVMRNQGFVDLIHYMKTGNTSETFSSVEFDKLKRNEYVKRELS